MDARIALGIVGRLRVPQRVVDVLRAIRRPTDYFLLSRVDVGIYQLQYTNAHRDPLLGLAPERWDVVVYKPSTFAMLPIRSMDVSYDRATWTHFSLD